MKSLNICIYFIAFLRFSFDSPSYIYINIYIYIYVGGGMVLSLGNKQFGNEQ